GELVVVFQCNDVIVVALSDGAGGEDDGFEEVAAGADGADLGEIGADLAAIGADAVAGGAGDLIAEEDLFAFGGISVLQERFEKGEALLLVGGERFELVE